MRHVLKISKSIQVQNLKLMSAKFQRQLKDNCTNLFDSSTHNSNKFHIQPFSSKKKKNNTKKCIFIRKFLQRHKKVRFRAKLIKWINNSKHKNLLAFKFEKIIDSYEKFMKNQYLHIFSVNWRWKIFFTQQNPFMSIFFNV